MGYSSDCIECEADVTEDTEIISFSSQVPTNVHCPLCFRAYNIQTHEPLSMPGSQARFYYDPNAYWEDYTGAPRTGKVVPVESGEEFIPTSVQ